ncbi:RNA polymerase sigma factor (sigma-70 family) [Cellulosimicrobium cellulans]|uniref:sigma-70 family RNA polymerase sigma factor n=1 Tax=Cellulosimicrobium cellulans TaxID=1710 RepID=UPI00195C715E|nr:sigma-70 family RNA polymerase sigma factor [Cellulosimicrobium cellulans]MBM7821400.1 RNA polymerase sigma factor (sigma-70 family) [Cellulosimicrobium cellulans]
MTQAQERVWSEAFSDAELITAVRGGDTSAYGALYERHAAAARTVARQYVRSTADADDVVSDAFARTLSVLQGGGGPDVTFRAYLFTVVRRLSYDLVNGARRTQPTDDERTFETAFGPMASTEDPTLEGFERSTVTRAYQDLPERWRAVLWYTEVENLSPAEIAPILGLTANGVSALAYRAREGLRQAYLQQHLTSVPAEECRTVNALLGSYVRGGLAKRETARVESHLESCGECRALVLELGDVSHGMRAVIAPLVLGVGALGLVGTALPTFGGAAVAGGVGAALQGSSSGGAGSAGGSGAAGGSGGAGAGAGGAGAAGTSTAGTGAAGGAGAAASAAGGSGGAVGAGAASVGGAAAAAGGAAAGSGALAAAGAGGLVALVTSAPLAAAAVTVGVLAVAGLGVAGALGVFSPDPVPTPTSQSSPSPSASPTTGTTTTPDPATDPTSPTNVPPAPTDETAAGTGDTTGTGGGSPTDGTTPVGSTPGTTTSGGSTDPGTGTPAPTDPGTGTPGPTDPGTPEPAPADLGLTLGADVVLVARQPADVRMTVSNSGGRAAQNVAVEVDLPPGVETVTSTVVSRGASVAPVLRTAALPCGPTAGGGTLTCAIGVLAPGEVRDLVVTVTARGGGSYEFPARVTADGLPTVRTSLKPPPLDYVGAEVRLDEERVTVPANPGVSPLTLTATNTGDRAARGVSFTVPRLPEGLSVRPTSDAWTCTTQDWARSLTCERDVVLPEPTRGAGAGTEVSLDVELRADGSYVPSARQEPDGSIRVEPAAFPVQVSAGGAGGAVTAERTMTAEVPLAWLGAEDVRVRAENVAGEVRYVAEVVNTTGAPVTVDVVVPDTPAWSDAEVPGRTSVDEKAGLTVDVNAPSVPESMILLTQERLLAGEPVPARPASDLALTLPPQAIAPTAPAPSVGQCVFDPATDTSSAPVSLTYDNRASTLPVVFSVDGRPDLTATVAGGATRVVDLPRAGTQAATYTVRADGHELGRHTVGAVDCFRWSVTGSASAGWSAESRAVVVEGAFHNGHAATTVRVVMDAGGLGTTEAVDVAPGEDATLTLDTGSRDVAAGTVVFRATRLGGPGGAQTVTAAYDAVRHAPAVGAPSVGTCVLDPKTELASAAVSLRYDNTRSTVPVVFSVEGRRDLTRTVDGGRAVTVDVPGGVGQETLRLAVLADGAPLTSHDVAGVDCFDWDQVTGAATATATWVVPSGAGVGTSVVTGTFHNPYAATTLRVGMSTPHGDAAPVDVAPGADATFTVDAKALSVPAGTATFTVERAAHTGPGPKTVEARYAAVTYAPRWATSATVDARWQDGSVKLVGTLTNDSPETVDVVMSAAGHGDSAPAQQVAPGATVTLTVDTRALDVKPGSVTFRQSRTVLGTPFADARLTARYQGDGYRPDWSATPTVSARCTAGTGGVVLTVGLRNDSAEAMHVVARTPFGDRDLGDVAPGASAGADLATGALAVKAGKVELALSRTVLGVPFAETLPVRYDAVDCAVEEPTASLVLGDPYYDAQRGHSYRAVSVLLDNSGSNVPVTFRVTGNAKGEWTVGAGERRTESLGEAPWSGATYVVHAGSWTEQLKVDDFTAVAACAPEWEAGVWYDHDTEVSYRGWNYTARNGSVFVRPDHDPLGLFWQRGARCGEG